jgi:hypothetical protein
MSVHVRIDTLRVTASSGIEARRLAAALPAAIERAWDATDVSRRAMTPADTVAERIVHLARAQLAARRALEQAP